MKKYLIALSLLSTLLACHHDDDHPDEPKDTRARRTILVYMAAENNLSLFATNDLTEMKTGSLSLAEDQNLIVYVDKPETQNPYLARVKGGELVDTLFMEESLTADPAILEKVLYTTKTKYPAKDYGLVLWGHASGWLISNDSVTYAPSRAYGGDTGNNSSSGSGKYWMNIPSMAKAIAKAMGNEKLCFILGDCCSFACIEVAYELRDVADYIIGSPAEIPDVGAPYDLIVADMFLESDHFYEQVINEYYNYCLRIYKESPGTYYNQSRGDLEGYSVPLTAIKTSELGNLARATAIILGKIGEKLKTPSTLDLTNVTFYARYGNHNYSYDMQQMFKNNTETADYEEWLTAFNLACPYHLYSQKWMTAYSMLANEMHHFDAEGTDCGATSMFFPSSTYVSTSPNWNTTIQQFQWNNDVAHWEQYRW